MELLIQRYNINTDISATNKVAEPLIHKQLASKQVLLPLLNVIHVQFSLWIPYWNHAGIMCKLIGQDISMLESKNEATVLLPFMTFATSSTNRES